MGTRCWMSRNEKQFGKGRDIRFDLHFPSFMVFPYKYICLQQQIVDSLPEICNKHLNIFLEDTIITRMSKSMGVLNLTTSMILRSEYVALTITFCLLELLDMVYVVVVYLHYQHNYTFRHCRVCIHLENQKPYKNSTYTGQRRSNIKALRKAHFTLHREKRGEQHDSHSQCVNNVFQVRRNSCFLIASVSVTSTDQMHNRKHNQAYLDALNYISELRAHKLYL